MERFQGTAIFLLGCCAATLLLSLLVVLLVGRWIQPEVLWPVWASFLTVPTGLSFAALVPYRRYWPQSSTCLKAQIFLGSVFALVVVHWGIVGMLLLASLPQG